jgi:hypothetical protein
MLIDFDFQIPRIFRNPQPWTLNHKPLQSITKTNIPEPEMTGPWTLN